MFENNRRAMSSGPDRLLAGKQRTLKGLPGRGRAVIETLDARRLLSTVVGPIVNPANGHSYYVVSKSNWTSAEAAAVALGGHLATINDAAENSWIVASVAKSFTSQGKPDLSKVPLWIGLYDKTKDSNGQAHASNFVWSDGETPTYRNWKDGEPNDTDNDEFYVALNWQLAEIGGPVGNWNDTPLNGTVGYGGTSDGPYYGIVEVAPSKAASIAGTVFKDADGDGVKDTGETGLSGVVLYNDADNDSVKDSSEATVTTDSSGNYKFTGLAAGSYKIRQVLPSGYSQTLPTNGFGYGVTLSAGQAVTGENFGDKPAAAPSTASISGTVFGDSDKDGVFDSSEFGLGMWTVYLDADKDGVKDAGEKSATTDINGAWSFTGLAAGTYVVRVVPVGGSTSSTASSLTITLTSGQAVTGKLFGEKKIA